MANDVVSIRNPKTGNKHKCVEVSHLNSSQHKQAQTEKEEEEDEKKKLPLFIHCLTNILITLQGNVDQLTNLPLANMFTQTAHGQC